MIGHDAIIAVRLNGYKPECVFVHVFDAEPEYFPGTHPTLSLQNGFHAEIHVFPMDRGILDFRCLVGLVVHLSGTDERRVMRIVRQIERAKPARLITALPDRTIDSSNFQPVEDAA